MKRPSKVQLVAQEQRALLKPSVHYDRVEDRGGIDKLSGGSVVQAAAAHKVAIKRCIEILTAANSNGECAEAVRLVADIFETVLEDARYSEEAVTVTVRRRIGPSEIAMLHEGIEWASFGQAYTEQRTALRDVIEPGWRDKED